MFEPGQLTGKKVRIIVDKLPFDGLCGFKNCLGSVFPVMQCPRECNDAHTKIKINSNIQDSLCLRPEEFEFVPDDTPVGGNYKHYGFIFGY